MLSPYVRRGLVYIPLSPVKRYGMEASQVIRKRLRFSVLDDITLLLEILTYNPYDDPSRWKLVQRGVIEKTGKTFSTRAVREHSDHLLKLWAKEDHTNLRRSGTEEQHREKEDLLQRVYRLCKEYKDIRNSQNSSKVDLIVKQEIDASGLTFLQYEDSLSFSDGEEINDPLKPDTSTTEVGSAREVVEAEPSVTAETDSVVDIVDESDNEVENSRSRNLTFKFLKDRNSIQELLGLKDIHSAQQQLKERQIALEESKLALESRRLKLEEEKWKLEKEEREKRLAMEIEERKHGLLTTEKKLGMLDFLLQQMNQR